jgi:hypothetical protein
MARRNYRVRAVHTEQRCDDERTGPETDTPIFLVDGRKIKPRCGIYIGDVDDLTGHGAIGIRILHVEITGLVVKRNGPRESRGRRRDLVLADDAMEILTDAIENEHAASLCPGQPARRIDNGRERGFQLSLGCKHSQKIDQFVRNGERIVHDSLLMRAYARTCSGVGCFPASPEGCSPAGAVLASDE